jgi:hypothetical protein
MEANAIGVIPVNGWGAREEALTSITMNRGNLIEKTASVIGSLTTVKRVTESSIFR